MHFLSGDMVFHMSNNSSLDNSTFSELLQSEMCVSLGCLWLEYSVDFSAGLRSFLFGVGELAGFVLDLVVFAWVQVDYSLVICLWMEVICLWTVV